MVQEKKAIHISRSEENIRYQDSITIVDPKAVGDNKRVITILLISETIKSEEKEEKEIIVTVYWQESDIEIFEESYDKIETALTKYNDIVERAKEIDKLLSVDQINEAVDASKELLDELNQSEDK